MAADRGDDGEAVFVGGIGDDADAGLIQFAGGVEMELDVEAFEAGIAALGILAVDQAAWLGPVLRQMDNRTYRELISEVLPRER